MLKEVGFVCLFKDQYVLVTCVYRGTYCKIFKIRYFSFWGTWMWTKKAQKEKKTTCYLPKSRSFTQIIKKSCDDWWRRLLKLDFERISTFSIRTLIIY